MSGRRPPSEDALPNSTKKPKIEKQKRKRGRPKGKPNKYDFQEISADNPRYKLITDVHATDTNFQLIATNSEPISCVPDTETNAKLQTQQQTSCEPISCVPDIETNAKLPMQQQTSRANNMNSHETFISTSNSEPLLCAKGNVETQGQNSTSENNVQFTVSNNFETATSEQPFSSLSPNSDHHECSDTSEKNQVGAWTNPLECSTPISVLDDVQAATCYQAQVGLSHIDCGSSSIHDVFELAFSVPEEGDFDLLAINSEPADNIDVTDTGTEPVESYADDFSESEWNDEEIYEPESETDQNSFDTLELYENADISVSEAILLIMTFSRRFRLSNVATQFLLKLIKVMLPTENNFITSLKQVKKYFASLDKDTKKIYYCQKCEEMGDSYGDLCECEPLSRRSNNYFLALPLEKQLCAILEGKDYLRLNHRNAVFCMENQTPLAHFSQFSVIL